MANESDPPLYMELGSKGKVVDLTLGFLDNWAKKNNRGPTGIEKDGEYGGVGVQWMKEYQASSGLNADGGCGPKTREQMKKDGFDFIHRANSFHRYVTSFVQPDGSVLYWAPGMKPTQDSNEIDEVLKVKPTGN